MIGYRTRLFLILWTVGIVGVLSFLLVDISALVASMPPSSDVPAELRPPLLLKLASIIQPTVLMSVFVLVGIVLTPRLGLHAPAAEAAARGENIFEKLAPQIFPGVVAGLCSGVALVFIWIIAKPYFSSEFVARAEGFNAFIPHAVRILYGGFTEEILLRWGVMSVLAWAAWRVLQGGEGKPNSIYMIVAIVLSSLLFGAGHLPVASMLNGGLTLPIVIYVVGGNSLFGIVAGFLFWKKGFEAAVIAHMCAHVVLIAAIYLSI